MSNEGNEEPNDYSHSFTDLMSSLAIIFLIFAVTMVCGFYILQKKDLQTLNNISTQRDNVKTSKESLLNSIKTIFEMKQDGTNYYTQDECISVDATSSYKVVLKFNGGNEKCTKSGLFYKSNEFTLNNITSSPTIAKIAKIYENLCSKINNDVDTIDILGHTDQLPSKLDIASCLDVKDMESSTYNELHCSNIYLSAQRARDTFLRIGQKLTNQNEIFTCFTSKTVVSGRGPFIPISSNDNRINRRVEIIINFKQPTIEI